MGKGKKSRLLKGSDISWLMSAVKGKKRYVAVEALLQALMSLGYIWYSLLFREMIDRAVGKDTPGFFRTLLILAAVVLTQCLLQSVVRLIEAYSSAALENTLKKRLFSTLLCADYSWVKNQHTAQWMNRLTSDTVLVADTLARIVPNLAGMIVKMAGAFVAILYLEPRFSLIAIPGGALIVLIGYFIRPIMKRLHKKIQEADGEVRVLLQERLDNLLIVKAYGQQSRSGELAEERMGHHLHRRMKRSAVSSFNLLCFGVAMRGMYLLAAGYGAWGILNGTLSYGTMMAMLQMVSYLQSPFSGIGGNITQWYTMLASAERLSEAELLARECVLSQEKAEDFHSVSLRELVFSYVERSREEELFVTIRYDNLCFRKGEFVALAGHSGCGKSTLLKLLLAVYKPESGEILVKQGSEEQLLTAAHRELFAYVPQGNMLMSGSIRQIIAFYDEDAMKREADLWFALRVACAEDFVSELPQGLDTVLGEHGAGLSEGQIQRIAIARAIFSRRPVLLLDEATSALDEKTEAAVLDNLKSLRNKTVLIVTHRPRACEICDRVIYMENREGGREDDGNEECSG